ncbi:MAG: 3-dehydroquinate synthase, partial [Gammaproteobacteria bacterium]
ATTHRGIRLTRVPTTVLAQNDSGVGVKNGINAFDTKNFLGTFAPPFAVLSDIRFIDTLEERDKRSGMAEAVKVSLIRDPGFFAWMEEHSDDLARFEVSAMAIMIRRCAELHMAHIAGGGDPFEFGSARPLDFGHWAAHKLEALTHYELRHGEAVAIGLALDCRYAVEIGLLDEKIQRRIHALLQGLGFTLKHDALSDETAVLQGLREFREHLGGELSITMIRDVGDALDVHHMAEDQVRMAIRWLRAA